MSQKVFYYRFNPFDVSYFTAIIMLVCGLHFNIESMLYWLIFCIETMLWCYKHLVRHTCAVITDKYIKIDHSNPLAWKDIKSAKIKDVKMFYKKRKILVLTPKSGVKYKYNFLQLHNSVFGAFPIPLYGILSPNDEQEIVRLVKKYAARK